MTNHRRLPHITLALAIATLAGSPARAEMVKLHGLLLDDSSPHAQQILAANDAMASASRAPAMPAEAAGSPGEDFGVLSTSVLGLGSGDYKTQTANSVDYEVGFAGGSVLPKSGDTLTGFIAPVHLPSGALITSFKLFYFDNDPASGMSAGVWRTGTTGTPELIQGLSAAPPPSFASGDDTITQPVDPALAMVDNATYNYLLLFILNRDAVTPSIQQRMYKVSVYYRLQVSPAPGSNTYSDVTVAHPYFQFVEALAASGITGGCGSGKYCPDATLTRGQMAVFLSKALGLHWPN